MRERRRQLLMVTVGLTTCVVSVLNTLYAVPGGPIAGHGGDGDTFSDRRSRLQARCLEQLQTA
jgi:hypothetical protein